jgi:lysophospholipase L1-like esterase
MKTGPRASAEPGLARGFTQGPALRRNALWLAVITTLLVSARLMGSEPLVVDLREENEAYSVERGRGFDLGTRPGNGKPFYYSIRVPEGNWRVTLSLGDPAAASITTVKAESRRLMLENVTTAAGEIVERSFIVNVRTPRLEPPPLNAPGGTEVRLNERERGVLHWDDKLTLEFNGAAPAVGRLRLEPASDAPTVFLAGDSTVTDQPFEPAASWGQMLPRFLASDVAVANHAESGETMKSFFTALRFDKLLSAVRPGDYVFIQFGHNDSKSQWPQTYAEAGTTYDAYLRVYIAEVKRRGATPVLVTSVHRRSFDEAGKIRNTHGAYLDAVRAVGRTEGVTVIDLAAMSAVFYEALGPEMAPRAFNNDGRDATHHNNYGAYQLARCVVEGIRAAGLPLAERLAPDIAPYDPARPDPVERFALAASPQRSAELPRGN